MSKAWFRLMQGRSNISRDVKSVCHFRGASDTLVLCIRKKKVIVPRARFLVCVSISSLFSRV